MPLSNPCYSVEQLQVGVSVAEDSKSSIACSLTSPHSHETLTLS